MRMNGMHQSEISGGVGEEASIASMAAGSTMRVRSLRRPLRQGIGRGLNGMRVSMAAALAHTPGTGLGFETVGDIMTTAPLVSCNPEMTIDAALELIVNCRVTGLPVLDSQNTVVGVVSDYDLLALEEVSGSAEEHREQEGEVFPKPGVAWKTFNEVQIMLSKSNGKYVRDVMTPNPIVVRATTNMEDAARILLTGKFRRLPVVDEENKLVGILTRGNVVRAALMIKRLNQKE